MRYLHNEYFLHGVTGGKFANLLGNKQLIEKFNMQEIIGKFIDFSLSKSVVHIASWFYLTSRRGIFIYGAQFKKYRSSSTNVILKLAFLKGLTKLYMSIRDKFHFYSNVACL